jgi:hypothetical protein
MIARTPVATDPGVTTKSAGLPQDFADFLPPRPYVDGIVEMVRQHHRPQRLARRVVKARQPQPVVGEPVGDDAVHATGRRNDTDAVAAAGPVAQHEVGRECHHVGIVDQHRAGIAASRREHRVGAGEARGVRARRSLALGAASGLEHDHGFLRLLRALEQVEETPAVAQSFDVQADHLGDGIGDHVLEKIADIEVCLVPDRDQLAETDALVVRAVVDRQHERAALGEQADVACDDLLDIEHAGRGKRHPVPQIDEPEAVRAHQTHAGLGRNARDLLLRDDTLRARFGEAGRDDDAAADAGRGALANGLRHDRRGHRDDGDVDRRRVGDPRIALAALDHFAARIERYDLAREPVERQIMHDPPAPFAAIVGGAEDRDPPGLEDACDRQARWRFRGHGINGL